MWNLTLVYIINYVSKNQNVYTIVFLSIVLIPLEWRCKLQRGSDRVNANFSPHPKIQFWVFNSLRGMDRHNMILCKYIKQGLMLEYRSDNELTTNSNPKLNFYCGKLTGKSLILSCSCLCSIFAKSICSINREWRCCWSSAEWSTILLPTKVRFILEDWRNYIICKYRKTSVKRPPLSSLWCKMQGGFL